MSFLLIGITNLSAQDDSNYVAPPRPVHQDKPKPNILDKLYYGGNLGFNFSQYGYFAGISPLIGYKVTDKFSAGITLVYNYYDYKVPGYGEFTNSIYGGGVFANYFILQNVFARVEAKVLNGDWLQGGNTLEEGRSNLFPLLVGGGYRGRINERASFYALIMYDLNYDPLRSPENSPISYTFGVGLGF